MNEILKSKIFKWSLVVLGELMILTLTFGAGVKVGAWKARFSYHWGENYQKNFISPHRGMMGFRDREFMGGHGITGSIIARDAGTLTIKSSDGVERFIVLKNDTAIMRFREAIRPENLRIDDQVVVIGQPNDAGQIEAKLIRVMPYPMPFHTPLSPTDTRQ